ncbi:serine/threonine-protein kinase SMG1 [Schistocerca piceifrons]|uniref:serine/threonine-protein kinase SMG1 n=1 Tax=Schistocerca piceifrons TaxID=274613 RepID=UPI001F5F5C1D|nr:serine/threonine-protein kinase SMG1 [Schistocerca piceifrons]
MITNSSGNKLKASKSARDSEDSKDFEVENKCSRVLDKDSEKEKVINIAGDKTQRNSLPTIVICQRDKGDRLNKQRPRGARDESRMARGAADGRSSNFRGRGAAASRKVERTGDSGYVSRRRFQEPLNKTSSSDSGFSASSKYYNDSASAKYYNDTDSNKSRLEDSRISKLLRLLCREDDKGKFLALCKQLQESLMAPENGRYIRRSLDLIMESLLDTLHSGPGSEAKLHAAKCLGRVGYVLDQDFKRYLDWVFQTYQNERNEDVKLLLMKAVLETLKLDTETLKLKDFASVLMAQLQNTLEYADSPEFLINTVDVILQLIDLYPEVFTKHFRDTVDILVGWHIDTAQKRHVIEYASESLQRLAQFWVADLQFSTTLLTQFLEDMESYNEEMILPLSGRSSPADGEQPMTPEQCVAKITSLIKVFNTVMKCLGEQLNPNVSPTIAWNFLINCFTKMLHTVVNVLQMFSNQDLIVSGNESTCLLLSYLQSRTSSGNELLYSLIDRQLGLACQFDDETTISMLKMISKVVREVSANLPVELVQKLLGPSSYLLELRFSPSLLIQKEVIGIHHSLLNLKNIPLLQEAYRYVLGDLERAYKMIVPTIEDFCQANPHSDTVYNEKDVKFIVMFHLSALADLANASNSIIGMWALKPSILELLAVKLEPYSDKLTLCCPALQYSLLYLLYSHCSRYNHFVSSSGLISASQGRATVCDILGLPVTLGHEVPTASPTSGHLSIILHLLSKMLSQETAEEILLLVLVWTRELLLQAQPYLGMLHKTQEFLSFIWALVKVGFMHNVNVVLCVLENIEQFLSSGNLPWQAELLSAIAKLCMLHLNSSCAQVVQKVCHLLTMLPWHVTVNKFSEPVKLKKKQEYAAISFTLESLTAAQRHHIARGICGEMQSQQFRKLMAYLLQGTEHSDIDWLRNAFCICWPLKSSDDNKFVNRFRKMAMSSDTVLLLWSVWEAAHFCVINKLRTPLGKPQDTFTSIEGAIKSLARELSSDDAAPEDWAISLREQRRVRLLLEFVEFLEKATHNAADGCATAMMPLPKPVRTFFHTNRSTCGEWLTRIRTAVVIVALHAGHATIAVRHGQRLLQDLAEAGNTQGSEFERAIMYVCWALCKLHEPEAIQGLYAWSKEIAGRKFLWLKAAAEQAARKCEIAAENFAKLVIQECTSPQDSPTHNNEESRESSSPSPVKQILRSEMEHHILGFMADQVTESYLAVNSWDDLIKWKEKEAELWGNQNGGTPQKYLLNRVTLSQAKALAAFDRDELPGASELEKWPSIWAGESTHHAKNWSSYRLLGEANNALMGIALEMSQQDKDETTRLVEWGEKIEDCLKVAQFHLQEGIRHSPSEFIQEATLLHCAASALRDNFNGHSAVNTFKMTCSDESLEKTNSWALCRALWWAHTLEQLDVNDGTNPDDTGNFEVLNQMRLTAARVARKEGNLALAQRLLIEHAAHRWQILTNHDSGGLLEIACRVAADSDLPWDAEKARACSEIAKLLYSCDQREEALNVCVIAAQQQPLPRTEGAERTARILLTFAKWLQEGHSVMDNTRDSILQLLACQLGPIPIGPHGVDLQNCSTVLQNGTQVVPAAETVVGQLLQLSVSVCPTLAKAWGQLGAWCYRWGRRAVDIAGRAGGGQLGEADRLAVQALVPSGIAGHDLDRVYSILGQTRALADEEDIEAEDYNTSEMIESQLQNVRVLSSTPSENLTCLVDIWRNAQKRVYAYYELSAMAYFRYLELCGDKEDADCSTITITLRLLRLIVKHALELQAVLETGLASTPTRPWKGIIPQLFSRLNHPEPYVRRRLSELLCRVAEDAPHLITFPAVVGASAGGARIRNMDVAASTAKLFGSSLSQPVDESVVEEDEEEEEDDDDDDDDIVNEDETQASVLRNCFLAMVDTLSKQAPEAISQVQLLVQELRRITLLWDELWLGTLSQHHTEISRRLQQLEVEVHKVDNNPALDRAERDRLIAEKHRIVLKPLVFVLEQLHSITSVPPETPHERWFQEKFGKHISAALTSLKEPSNPRRPNESWAPMKQLQAKLQQRVQKRAAYSLRMSDISPSLASLKNTLIAMPGVTPRAGTIINIASVDNNIAILPTKTKPKKLVFHGSNGQMYTYLFKGLEDLHLDERIMQFLSIANTMMRQGRQSDMYYARHYSVIPLGPRSGLISWVDGATPLFGLYKRWQQREAAAASLKTQSSSTATSNTAPGQIMRPSELFYKKLTPLLKEKGIALENRKEWPPAVLQQVLTELIEETPKDLLFKELWCNSLNAGAWWQTTRTYSYSVAVMSVIGYIIGLGDRHLDNVLVDLSTGEVVHIDYNVCFEKGKTLRVPENVPFRMTSNIRTALGVTGVEGIFRLACENVLKIMKRGRETLLTLLEAFVYDPLIDWTPGNEAGYTGAVYGGGQAVTMETRQSRKELEREVTYAMFNVRVAEMQADWFKNRDEIQNALPEVKELLLKWLEQQASMRVSCEALQDSHQLMALVKEAESQPTHPLYSLATRHSAHRRVQDALSATRAALQERLEECDKHLTMHKNALACVHGTQIQQWLTQLNQESEKDYHLVFDLVKEFLQNAGQSQMIVQCEQSESELGSLAKQQTAMMRSCLDLLSHYGTVTSLYPVSYLSSHRSACYRRWLTALLQDLTLDRCNEVAEQFRDTFSADVVAASSSHAMSQAFQLQAALSEANSRLQESFERVSTTEGLPEPQLEAQYIDACTSVSTFLHTEPGAAPALECVCITALCALNKRYLMMEAAAASAGDCLVDLTSRDGDWFLDEMYLVSSLVTELTAVLPSQPDPTVQIVLQCLKSANNIFKGLQELNFNFHTIILPEALKTIQTEDPTVLNMICELNDIIASVGIPLHDILAQLEIHLRYIIMEMDSPHGVSRELVAQLRARFEGMLLRPANMAQPSVLEANNEDALAPGLMLLMGFNGLFEKLQLDGNALVATLETLDTPVSWRKVDQIRDAKAMSAPVFKEQARAVLEDVFLVKRLQTMQEFFSLCGQTTANGGSMPHDDDHLSKPVRRFTADYVGRQLLGVASQTLAITLCLLLQRIGLNVSGEVEQRDIGAESKVSLEELCRKAVEAALKRGLVGGNTLAQASSLTSSLEAAWRRREVARHLQRDIEARRSTLRRLQLQATAHAWLHEDALAQTSPQLSRSSFMLELRKASSALLALQTRLTEAREQQNTLVASVEQRLKWAAGANPALAEVLAAFGEAVAAANERMAQDQRLASLIGSTCNALLHHEALRTRTSEAVSQDAAFLQLLEQCEKSCMLAASCNQTITPAEENLVQLLPPAGPVDQAWIQDIEICISDKAKSLQEQISLLQETVLKTQETVKGKLLSVRELQTVHLKLMQDVRSLMRSMTKFDDCPLVGLNDYLANYRYFLEQFTNFVKDLSKEDFTVERVLQAKEEVDYFGEKIGKVYGQLVEFSKQLKPGGQEAKPRRPPLMRQESLCFSPQRGIPQAPTNHRRDPNTGKAVQERNAYALGVWRRVRMKLEGRDPDPNKRASVQEQVDYVIREAMCLKNLALLYEGWTPWV